LTNVNFDTSLERRLRIVWCGMVLSTV